MGYLKKTYRLQRPAHEPRDELPPESHEIEQTAPKPRLLDRFSQEISARHYSRRTEKAYKHWIKQFIFFSRQTPPRHHGGGRYCVIHFGSSDPTDSERCASTQNQALSALVFLYRRVLRRELDDMELVRAKRPTRLPLVLTRREVDAVLTHLEGAKGLMARLQYGSGLRLLECCRSRVKDVDLERCELLVRDGKGEKDRVTMLPDKLVTPIANQIRRVRSLHNRHLKWEAGFVELPYALARKYPNAPREWGWQWIFPATRTYHHRETGLRRRHFMHQSTLQRYPGSSLT